MHSFNFHSGDEIESLQVLHSRPYSQPFYCLGIFSLTSPFKPISPLFKRILSWLCLWNHNCKHNHWKSRNGGHNMQEKFNFKHIQLRYNILPVTFKGKNLKNIRLTFSKPSIRIQGYFKTYFHACQAMPSYLMSKKSSHF